MKRLKFIKKKHSGRSNSGKVVVRHQGGQHKRYIREVDFKRSKHDIKGKVIAIEYDPNRTCDVALIQYADGEKRYILAPVGLKVGSAIIASSKAPIRDGNAMSLSNIPVGTIIHNVELTPGKGGQLGRGAGTGITLSAKEGEYVHLKLPSGEVRRVSDKAFATIGQLGNIDWKNEVIGTAGRARRMGRRPTVRGTAMNPRSHPHGGGEGRSGIGLKSPKTVYGRKAVGKTRRPNKYSNRDILQGRKKKK